MSTLQTTNLKNASSGSNNIVLGTGGDTTITNNLTVSGTGNQSIAGTLQFNSGYGSVATAYGCRAWVNFNGTANTNLSGTYSQSGTTVTVTATAHGLLANSQVYADITSGTGVDGTYTVATVVDANTFTYTAGTSLTTSGNVTLVRNTIRASGNVSSITDNGTGDYTVNFTNALADANYSCVAVGGTVGDSIPMTPAGNGTSFLSVPATTSIRLWCKPYGSGVADPTYAYVAIFR